MFSLRCKYRKKAILLIIFMNIGLFYPLLVNNALFYDSKENTSKFQDFNLDQVRFDQESYLNWRQQIIKADGNENGISDLLEARLKDSFDFESNKQEQGQNKVSSINDNFRNQNVNPEIIPLDNIPIIIQFPEGDFTSLSLLFKALGGKIKSTYKAAINGFAGRINQNALNEFSNSLREFKIPFFIEEDRIYQAQLYYAGRNMNLRPYVWNNLSYDGDEYSSIAIIDTGIDDSHNFFSPGYPDKIVGWRDEVNFLGSPYDDNGHGSHCSGISAGEGTPDYDVSGRSVTTAAYEFNYTSYDIPAGTYIFNWTRFNVTEPGLIEIFCEFDDFTPGSDDVDLWVYMYYGNTIVDSYEVNSDSWSHTLSYTTTSDTLGAYSFRLVMTFIDNTFDGYVSDLNIRFRGEIHWPFDPPQFDSGDPWKGVAPDANLVGVKVLDQYGSGWSSDIINGINWVITNRTVYNITTMSLSLGGSPGQTSMINAVNNAVENGIVTVVSAGNSGPGDNLIGSPGDADNVITVAAMSIDDKITDYSSQGGTSYTGNTVKPDITAPGGSFNNLQMFSTDTNDNDGEGAYSTDAYANDLMGAQGTSMSAPAVAGASNLLIEAMGGHEQWGYTATEAKKVKALLLMTATETYPLLRELYDTMYSPLLNRGGKDVHEGYGRLNVDVAIEAYTNELTLGSQFNASLTSSLIDPFKKHGLGCFANLISGQSYIFTLDVPSGADFDLHLYSDNPSSIGEPIMVASSTSTGLGTDEIISYTATNTGKYYLIAKAISGEGNAKILYPIVDHDLKVSLEVPSNPDINNTYIINTTVTNTGNNIETDVELFLYLDSELKNSTNISSLPIGASKTINYTWIPLDYGKYNFTTYAPPVPDEVYLTNNLVTKFVSILNITLFDGMFTNYTFTIFGSEMSANFLWSHVSDYIFHTDWYMDFNHDYWDVDAQTRVMSNSGGTGWHFGDGYHTPLWIFTNLSLGNQILIAVDAAGDHVFEVSSELIYDIPGFGLVEVWVLEDLTIPGGIAWYEKSSGILLNGTFFYDFLNPSLNYTFNFVNTNVQFSYITLDHDLKVSLEVPSKPEIGNTYIIDATITNNGKNIETNIDLFLYLDSELKNSTNISTLPIGASKTINYTWIPLDYGKYNFTAYAPPLPSETIIWNNKVIKLLIISTLRNYTMTPGTPYNWIDASGGTELFLSDDGYAAIALPFDFTFYNDTFSTIYLCSNGYLSFADTDPWHYSNLPFPLGDPDYRYMIAPFWDDIYPPDGGDIYVQSFGTYWVAEWLNIYHIHGTIIGTFEVVLYDTGVIVFNYDYLDYTSGGYTCGLNLGADTDYYNSYQGLNDLTDNFAIDFFPGMVDLDHDLSVSLEVPSNPDIGNTYIINATVTNTGNNIETDVELFLYLDSELKNSTNISSLPIGASKTINYTWTPLDYGKYNFTTYAPPVLDEVYLTNNLVTKFVSIMNIILFDGMYIDHIFKLDTFYNNSRFTYSYITGDFFNETWQLEEMWWNWTVNAKTRIMTGGSLFGDGAHTPAWIYPDTILNDNILIGVINEGDHLFEVISELVYDLPGFGLVEVWVLEDLTYPGGVAWYEKSTGILLNGTFYFGPYPYGINYTFEFVYTNAFDALSSVNITAPDSSSSWEKGSTQSITWTSTGAISDVKIELYNDDVFVMEIIASTINDGEFSWTIPQELVGSSLYRIKITDVDNQFTNDFSDYFEIFKTPGVTNTLIITNPDSASSWEKGTTQSITWSSTGSISDLKIGLYKGGVFEMEIVASTPNDGSYTWTIPTDLEDGEDYQIRISDVSNPTTHDNSPNFAITHPTRPPIPGYNFYLIIGIIGILSIMLIKRRVKKA